MLFFNGNGRDFKSNALFDASQFLGTQGSHLWRYRHVKKTTLFYLLV